MVPVHDTTTAVESVLRPLRETLSADGAELQYVSPPSGKEIVFRLDLANSNCQECVLPKEQLEELLLFAARKAVPGLRSVTVVDPRVDA
jgi:hypothetical protein